MKKVIHILIVVINLTSCEKTIQYDVHADNLIVVNSLISAGTPIEIKLSQSTNITERDTIKYVNNATIGIYCGNVFIENAGFKGDGIYKSSFVPEQGKEYRIEVQSDGFVPVISKTHIPMKANILSVAADSSSFEGFRPRVRITFRDDTSVKNYYYLTIKSFVIESSIDYSLPPDTFINGNDTMLFYKFKKTERFSDLLYINNDPIISGKEGSTSKETVQAILGTTETGLNVINWLAFSDLYINGTIHTIELYLANTISPSKDKPIYVELKSINEDYFKYLKSKSYLENSGNNPFSEPIRIYNNIDGGAGIFAGFNMAVDSIVTIGR